MLWHSAYLYACVCFNSLNTVVSYNISYDQDRLLARFLTRFLGRCLPRCLMCLILGGQEIQCTVLLGWRTTLYSITRTETNNYFTSRGCCLWCLCVACACCFLLRFVSSTARWALNSQVAIRYVEARVFSHHAWWHHVHIIGNSNSSSSSSSSSSSISSSNSNSNSNMYIYVWIKKYIYIYL